MLQAPPVEVVEIPPVFHTLSFFALDGIAWQRLRLHPKFIVENGAIVAEAPGRIIDVPVGIIRAGEPYSLRAV